MASEKRRPIEGDWVRFMHAGVLVIGAVEYVCPKVGGRIDLYTTAGIVEIDSVLEARSPGHCFNVLPSDIGKDLRIP